MLTIDFSQESVCTSETHDCLETFQNRKAHMSTYDWIYVNIWQKPKKYYKAIILQFKQTGGKANTLRVSDSVRLARNLRNGISDASGVADATGLRTKL